MAHSDLDERAIEALKEFNEEGALQVLVQFKESDLSHVQVGGPLQACCPADVSLSDVSSAPEQKRLPLRGDEDLQAEGEAGDQSFRFH